MFGNESADDKDHLWKITLFQTSLAIKLKCLPVFQLWYV